MKNNILLLVLLLASGNGFSQNAAYEYTGRYTPSVKQEKLKEARSISDITPELWSRLVMSSKDRDELEYQRKKGYSLGFYLYPMGGYELVINYVSVEISADSHGKTRSAESNSDKLTAEQKNILNTADAGTDINIRLRFNYKDRGNSFDKAGENIQGGLTFTVVPETEAVYPGGFKQLTAYLTQNILDKAAATSASAKIKQAVVTFTVNEEGQVMNAKIGTTSENPKTDHLILEAIHNMPKWTPAKNSKGEKVKEEFSIPFGPAPGC